MELLFDKLSFDKLPFDKLRAEAKVFRQDQISKEMTSAADYQAFEKGSEALIAKLVEDHHGWATAIAKSVARAWNLDWQLDGLDGGAYEGLLFCAGRYDPQMGVPFKGYARRRIHEASTEEARQSKAWKRGTSANTPDPENDARELSARLLETFPEIREGVLPFAADDSESEMRISISQLLTSAALLSAFERSGAENPEIGFEYRKLVKTMSGLEPVHQEIVYGIYWRGLSMRALADEWSIDELAVIREHTEILKHLCGKISGEAILPNKKLKIRRGLKNLAMEMKRRNSPPPFERFNQTAMLLLLADILAEYFRGSLYG